MCNLPTTGIWLDGLLCHCIIIFLSEIPTSCTTQVIPSLVLVCLPNPVNATFNLSQPRIPKTYVIPRFLCRVVHLNADAMNNLSTGVAFIKGYEKLFLSKTKKYEDKKSKNGKFALYKKNKD